MFLRVPDRQSGFLESTWTPARVLDDTAELGSQNYPSSLRTLPEASQRIRGQDYIYRGEEESIWRDVRRSGRMRMKE